MCDTNIKHYFLCTINCMLCAYYVRITYACTFAKWAINLRPVDNIFHTSWAQPRRKNTQQRVASNAGQCKLDGNCNVGRRQRWGIARLRISQHNRANAQRPRAATTDQVVCSQKRMRAARDCYIVVVVSRQVKAIRMRAPQSSGYNCVCV